MNALVTRLSAVLVALTLLALGAWAGTDWVQAQQRAQDLGQTQLRHLAGVLAEASVRQQALAGPALSAELGRQLGRDPRWKMVLLSSPAAGTLYYRGPQPSVPVDKAVPRWEARDLAEVKISLPVFLSGTDPLTLEGIYEFYGRAELFTLFKAFGLSLFVLLVGLSTLMVVLWARSDPPAPEAPAARPAVPPTLGGVPEAEDDEEYWFDDKLTMEDLPPLETPAEVPAAPAGSKTGFSTVSGLVKPSFLPSRLDLELERSVTAGNELSLIVLAVKGSEPDAEDWVQALRDQFPEMDLTFEYDGGAAVILPDTDLERALQQARSFVETAERQLKAVVHAGVASRAGRSLAAQTLMNEGASAKRRSLAGSIRVLGLKADPDRYKDELESA